MRVFDSVDAIGKEAIDAIADDPFFTYEWFKTLEITDITAGDTVYVAVYDAGKLVAFAPCFVSVSGDCFGFGPNFVPYMKQFLKLGKRFRLWKKDFLLCYSPYCGRTKVLFGKKVESRVLDELVKKIDGFCREEGVLFSFFPCVSEFDKGLFLNLEKLGYRKLFFRESFCLDVCWSSFEDYLKSLKYHTRSIIRNDIRHCEKKGIIIEEVGDFREISAILSDLCGNLLSKYQCEQSPFSMFFYETLNDCLKDKVRVFIAKKNGVVVGFSICLNHGKILDVFHSGFNYDLIEKEDRVYFNLAYYEPIKWAIKEGMCKIYFRMAAEEIKRRRGCRPEKVYSFIKCHNRFVDWQIAGYLKLRRSHVYQWR